MSGPAGWFRSVLLCGLCCCVLAAWAGQGAAAPSPSTAADPERADGPRWAAAAGSRPRIGLVLSGGGARGLAHVGVLKVLERERIPVHLIAGTSMGAIIGGLYASGMTAAELERELLTLDWEALFANRIPRENLSQRRKEEDFEISPAVEIGLDRRSGSPMLPLGSVSSRGLELLLRRYTLPVRLARSFDALPIPFRAVATDMESGQAVVFREGDLAQALRASMSVPGVFPPTEVGGRILGDGGLVDNLPVEVVRRLGAEQVIAVNIGTPLAGRETLGSVVGLTAQMINILTEQNVQRSIASLREGHDLLLAPDLGGLSSGDFSRAAELMVLGERHAQQMLERLRPLALEAADWAQWQQQHRGSTLRAPQPRPIVSLRFEGNDITHPEHFAGVLASRPGQPFRVEDAERDSRALAATGDYLHAEYRVEDLPAGTGLVFVLREKPWGPNYFNLGLDLQSDFAGRGEFNVKLNHNRHWLNAQGGEWRNRLQVGSVPRWASEWYQPLGAQRSLANDWFFAVAADLERRRMTAYEALEPNESARDAHMAGRAVRGRAAFSVDLGQPLGDWGEWRTGMVYEALRIDPEIVSASISEDGSLQTLHSREWAARAALVVDQLDHATFPRRGWRLKVQAGVGRRWSTDTLLPGETESFHRIELDGHRVFSRGPHTLDASLRLQRAHQRSVLGLGHYSLGGFHNLSGYKADQLSGNQVLLGRAVYTLRLNQRPVLTRGFFAGASLEAGNTWSDPAAVQGGALRWGGSLFLGADTGLGPLYLGLTWAPLGAPGVYLLLGRP